MAKLTIRNPGEIHFEGPLKPSELSALSRQEPVRKISITKTEFTKVHAHHLLSLQHIESLWLWDTVEADVLRKVLELPKLKELDLLGIQNPDIAAKGFAGVPALESFRCNCGDLTAADLIELAHCKALKCLGAQGARISNEAISALASSASLEDLDIEGSRINDEQCATLATSTSLRHLHVANTRLSASGFRALTRLHLLESLDVWLADITNDDLQLLRHFERLKYLSIGQPYCAIGAVPRFLNDGGLRCLVDHSSLERLWLHGAALSEANRVLLESRFQWFRYEPTEYVDANQLGGEHE